MTEVIKKAIRQFENACSHAWSNDENVSTSRSRQLHAEVDKCRNVLEDVIAAEMQKARKDAFRSIINDVCRDLPSGWIIDLQLELDAGTLHLLDSDGNDRSEDFPSNRECLLDELHDAVVFAQKEMVV